MRRAVILATFTCILFAVAGVTAARENSFTSSSQDRDQTESTVPEPRGPERTAPEATVPETTVPEDVEKLDEGMVEVTIVVPEEPKEPGKEDPGAGNYGGIQDDNGIEEARQPAGKPGKPEPAQGGKKYGKPRVTGKPPGKSRPDTSRPDDAGAKGFDGNPDKVILCHKNKVTISVGAPAKPAHLRHGDSLGPADAAGRAARAGSGALLAPAAGPSRSRLGPGAWGRLGVLPFATAVSEEADPL